jgi:tetratricopeptide (TPR) repeat protein
VTRRRIPGDPSRSARAARRARVATLLIAALAAAVALPLPGCGIAADRERKKGVALYEADRYDDAVSPLRRALRWNAKDVEARATLALALTRAGRSNEAIEEWIRVLKVMPDWADGHYYCGVAYISTNRLQRAMQEWVQTLELDSTHVGAHYNLGIGYVQTGVIPLAVEEWTQLLEIDPTHYEARVNRGRLRVLQDDARGALEDFLIGIAIKPDRAVNYLAAGEVSYQLADSARAVALIDSFFAKHAADDEMARKARSLRARIVAGLPPPAADRSSLGVQPIVPRFDDGSARAPAPNAPRSAHK